MPKVEQCADNAHEEAAAELELVGDVGVVRLSADALVDLDVGQRILAYHLVRAAAAAEPIAYAQRSPHGLRVKNLAEELALHRGALPDDLRAKVETFTRQVFVHKGIYHAATHRKLAFAITGDELERASLLALKDGAKFDNAGNEAQLRAVITKLRPVLFDPRVEPSLPVSPSASKPSAVMLEPVISALVEAMAHAKPEQKSLIALQIRALQTGAPRDVAAYERAWGPTQLPVDFVVSFPGTDDARVLMLDAARTSKLQKLVDVSAGLLPQPQNARVLALDAAPLWLGMSTRASTWTERNPAAARARLLVLGAATDAVSDFLGRVLARGFLADASDEADVRRCVRPSRAAYQILSSLAELDAPALGEHAALMTALRAQVTALVTSNDAKLRDAGMIPDARCARLVSELYVAEHLLALRAVKPGESLLDPAERARSIVVRFALQRGALREVLRDGNVVLQLADDAAWRRALADLEGQVGDIVRRGDRAGAKKLAGDLSDPPNPRWCSSAAERAKLLGMPDTLVLLPPRLKALRAEDGRLQDATLVESLSLIETALIDAGKMPAP